MRLQISVKNSKFLQMKIPNRVKSHDSITTLSIKQKNEMEDEATALSACEGETCGSGMVGVRALPQVELVT